MLLWQTIIVSLISVMMILDSRMFGRLNFERPLITCFFCGLLLGNLPVGLAVGAQMEMMSMGMMSIGASGIDMNMGSLVGCALCIITGSDIETAITVAVPMTMLSSLLGTISSVIRIHFTHMCDNYVEHSNYKMAKRVDIVYGPCLYVLFTVIPVFLSVYFGSSVVQAIAEAVPAWVTNGISLGSCLICFYGFACLLVTMVNRNTVVYFFAGFLLAAYSKLGLTAIALIGTVLALMLYQVKYGDSGKIAAAASGTKSLDEQLDDLDN